jgi:anthranilate phosphoribosyltransferase
MHPDEKEARGAMTPVEALLSSAFDASTYPLAAQVRGRIRAAQVKKGDRSSVIDFCVEKLVEGQELSDSDARAAFQAILKGGLAEDQIGALLFLLVPERLRASTIATFAEVVYEHATKVQVETADGEALGDTCGTGGDARGTFNVSTAIMFILAAGGVKIAKHGNKAFTSRCGSADVLQQLGVNIDLDAAQVRACIERAGVGFMFAPRFHESFKNVQSIRKRLADEMPVDVKQKTIFNILGPLANPAHATCQIIGVYDGALTSKFAEVLKIRGVARALVPHGEPVAAGDKGFDEFSIAGPTIYAELNGTEVQRKTMVPKDAGLEQVADPDTLKGGDKEENARILRGVLENNESRERIDFALLNAGAGFYVAGKATSIGEGVRTARALVENGKAVAKLDELRELSNRLATA